MDSISKEPPKHLLFSVFARDELNRMRFQRPLLFTHANSPAGTLPTTSEFRSLQRTSR